MLGYIYYVTFLIRRNNIFLRLSNYALYHDKLWQLIRKFETDFHLQFEHVSKVDIALDSTLDTSIAVYNMMKEDYSIDWVINGHRIYDRDATIKELFWTNSGSLNNPDANRSLYVKQSEGLTLNCYDKTCEVSDKFNNKYYQIGDWYYDEDNNLVEGDNIYRNETRLTRKSIINYTTGHHINDNQFLDMLQSPETLSEIFRNTSRKLIRWNKKGKSQDITTLISSC